MDDVTVELIELVKHCRDDTRKDQHIALLQTALRDAVVYIAALENKKDVPDVECDNWVTALSHLEAFEQNGYTG